MSRVSVLRPPAVIRHAAECIERLFYSVFVCPRVSSRTEDYVTWKLHRPSFFGGPYATFANEIPHVAKSIVAYELGHEMSSLSLSLLDIISFRGENPTTDLT